MTFRDLTEISLGNLWRMKLRAALTVGGVVIAIATFTAMLSFGVGNQQYVEDQFSELGLFNTIQVYPLDEADSTEAPALDDRALTTFMDIPGVNLAYPLNDFGVSVTAGDSTAVTRAQALPGDALRTRLFSQLAAGSLIDSDEVMITSSFAERLGFAEPDSAIGQELVLTTSLSSLDSGLVKIFTGLDEEHRARLRSLRIDSLMRREYAERVVKRELADAARRFFDGYMNSQLSISDTLEICGVLKTPEGGRARIRSVIVPPSVALRLNAGGVATSPTDLLSALNSGNLFAPVADGSARSYTQATLDIDPKVAYEPIRDSVEALGYRVFSYAEQFGEIRRFFFYFDLALSVIGIIALITAALGIVNTMVMSIMERTREIGVLKSLGADDGEVRLLFLVESGAIGVVGSVLGVILGWIVTRIASVVAQTIMANEGVELPDLFALPLWLILLAIGFGTIVAVLAGWYPSRRAARIDPVEALRAE